MDCPHPRPFTRRRTLPVLGLALMALLPSIAHAHGTKPHGAPHPSATAALAAARGNVMAMHPQLASDDAGKVLLLWGRTVPPHDAASPRDGGDLLLSRWDAGTGLSVPVRVNDAEGTAQMMAFDEIRPSIAAGPDGRVAVAWTDIAGDVRLAESRDGGTSFAPALRLNQDNGKAGQAFVVVAFDAKGRLHAAWLDSRLAPPREEEPSQLYHAVVDGAGVHEQCVTCGATASVCGCCRPWMGPTAEGGVEILFRNTSPDGYRDISGVAIAADGTPTAPVRFGPAMWKIKGCPSAGPILAAGRIVWRDGSLGRMRLVAVSATPGAGGAVAELRGDATAARTPTAGSSAALADDGADAGAWEPTWSPRPITGAAQPVNAVLAPGEPTPRVLRRTPGGLEPSLQAVPSWCSSALVVGDKLLCAGVQAGKLMLEPVAWDVAAN